MITARKCTALLFAEIREQREGEQRRDDKGLAIYMRLIIFLNGSSRSLGRTERQKESTNQPPEVNGARETCVLQKFALPKSVGRMRVRNWVGGAVIRIRNSNNF